MQSTRIGKLEKAFSKERMILRDNSRKRVRMGIENIKTRNSVGWGTGRRWKKGRRFFGKTPACAAQTSGEFGAHLLGIGGGVKPPNTLVYIQSQH